MSNCLLTTAVQNSHEAVHFLQLLVCLNPLTLWNGFLGGGYGCWKGYWWWRCLRASNFPIGLGTNSGLSISLTQAKIVSLQNTKEWCYVKAWLCGRLYCQIGLHAHQLTYLLADISCIMCSGCYVVNELRTASPCALMNYLLSSGNTPSS